MKNLLNKWEELQIAFLEKLDFKQLHKEYIEWFADEPNNYDFTEEEETQKIATPKRAKYRIDMINALIESERDYRKDDSREDLAELIKENKKKRTYKKEIAVEQIVINTSWTRMKNGSVCYDFDIMHQELETQLINQIKNND